MRDIIADPDELLTPNEVSRIRKVSIRHLARERAEGIGPAFIKEHFFVRYRRRDLNEWLEARRIIAGQAA